MLDPLDERPQGVVGVGEVLAHDAPLVVFVLGGVGGVDELLQRVFQVFAGAESVVRVGDVSVEVQNGFGGGDGGCGVVLQRGARGEPVGDCVHGVRGCDLGADVDEGESCDVVRHLLVHEMDCVFILYSLGTLSVLLWVVRAFDEVDVKQFDCHETDQECCCVLEFFLHSPLVAAYL